MAQVLLIHGAGDAGYWRYVAPRLGSAGHTVLVPQLPSGDPDADFESYAAAALRDVDPARPVVVIAQSMGAFTAPVVASRTATEAIVLVAPMIPAPGETPGEWAANVGLEAAQQRAAVAGGYEPGFDLMRTFFHDVPDAVVRELMAEGEPVQTEEIFRAPCPIERWPEVPTHVVAGTADRLFPFELIARVARDRLGAGVRPIDSGHLPAFACPGALTGLLLDAIPHHG